MLPSGTVTFLFTDIEGSSELWEEYPQAMNEALARHDANLRDAIQDHQGFIVKTTGDGVHAVFDSAVHALNSVLSAQQSLLAFSWPANTPLRVRMALHSGQADFRAGDYYGPDVNRAARLMSLAAGGQILVSAATAALIRHQLPAQASLLDLGSYRLRSLAHPEQIFQLLHPDLPAEFPPLVSHGQTPNNLPEQLTSFIGREREIAAVQQLLAPAAGDEGQTSPPVQPRLISLIGPGGTGKTRLSLQVGAELLDDFADGVWLAELAPLTDPQFIVPTVAAPLGLSDQPGRPLLDRLAQYLRPRRVLLILDNCEHLIDDCAAIAEELLRACPQLRILASSREALGIIGEQAFRVRSLSLPAAPDGLSRDELSTYEAINLFVQRATAVQPAFTLTQDNAASVLQICRQLDGIPLAIELAAARLRVLTPAQIAARLDHRFRLLTGGSRTALPRQRTLAALIDWSYDLLSEAEMIFFHCLSVFSGGWTLEAAESIAAFDPIEPYEVLDLLEQLVSKSLVTVEETDLGMRYQFLETIRQYAQEKLAASGEADALRERHLDYFVGQSRQAMQDMWELRGGNWIERLCAASDNLRSARSWALDNDLRAALQFGAGWSPHFTQCTPDAEALRYLKLVLEQVDAAPEFIAEDAPSENRRLLGAVLASAGGVAFRLGLNPLALEYDRRSAAIAQDVGDLGTLAWVQGMTASVSNIMGDRETARRKQEESDLLAEETAPWPRAMGRITGLVLARDSQTDAAWIRWEEGMAVLRQGDDLWGLGFGHQMAAFACLIASDQEGARFHAERSLFYYREIGAVHIANVPHSVLAIVAWQNGDLDQAVAMFFEILQVWRDVGNAGAAARCLESLAFIARVQKPDQGERDDRLAYAATLLGAADALRRANNAPMAAREEPEYETELTAIKAEFGEENFNTACRRGQQMTLDQAIAFAQEYESM